MDKIYIGIESLLDLELAMVRKYKKPKIAMKYLKRCGKTDAKHPSVQFGMFTQEEFDKHWDDRDKELLQFSVRTRMYSYLREILSTVESKVLSDPQDSNLEIHVDLFPFELAEKEKDWIMSSLIVLLGYDANIKFMDMGIGGVNSAFLEHYKWVFIKDIETWLSLSVRSLKAQQQLEVNVILPGYTTGDAFSDLVADPDIDLEVLATNSPHEFVKSLLGQIVRVDFIDPRYFKACLE